MKLGGFVIHGNNVETLGRCLNSLTAVCDEVVAIDSESTDGSAALVRDRGVRHVVKPWAGFGAARAAAVRELQSCDYILFLDSDEQFGAGAADVFHRVRRDPSAAPCYRIRRQDWADIHGRRFLFRSESRLRLIRREHARWTPEMIVHEALPSPDGTSVLPVIIVHEFAHSLAIRSAKNDLYALLWAVRAHGEGRRSRGSWQLPRRVAHTFRDGVIKGAFWRGGSTGLQLAWQVSRYHAMKHRYWQEIAAGQYPELVGLFRSGEYAQLFRAARRLTEAGIEGEPGESSG